MAYWLYRRWESGARVVKKSQWGSWIPRSDDQMLELFKANPFWSPIFFFSFKYHRKTRQGWTIGDHGLELLPGGSVNDRIPKDSSLVEATSLRYLWVDTLTQLVREKGADCALMKCDLKRTYKQIQFDPRNWNYLGLKWQGNLYFDMTMPMGLKVGGNVLAEAHQRHRVYHEVAWVQSSGISRRHGDVWVLGPSRGLLLLYTKGGSLSRWEQWRQRVRQWAHAQGWTS